MPVTELAWFTGAHGPITTEGKEATNQALTVQDEWLSRNTSLPKDRESRGVGFFQQVEDPSIGLLTAHWESVAQHGVWLESPENKTIYPALKDHFQLEKTVLFHLADTELFGASGTGGGISLLQSPIISIGRVTIAAEKRQAFEQGWDGVKGIVEGFADIIKYGWRIEKEDPALEGFVLVGGWPSVEKHGEFATTKDFPKFSSLFLSFAQTRDIKHYRRIL